MHLKLFFLNGFGYAADSLILALQAVTASQAALEFRPSFAYGLNVAVYTGMLLGVLFWGLGSTGLAHRCRSKTFTESVSLLQVRTSSVAGSLSTSPSSPPLFLLSLLGHHPIGSCLLLLLVWPRKSFSSISSRSTHLATLTDKQFGVL